MRRTKYFGYSHPRKQFISSTGGELCSTYQRKTSFASIAWSLWLCAPDWIRYSAYYYPGRLTGVKRHSRVWKLPFALYAKTGDRQCLIEALATQFVSRNTAIPVPHVLDVIVNCALCQREVFVLTTALPGEPMNATDLTLNNISESQLLLFADIMSDWLGQLRSIPPPPGDAVCGFLGTPVNSYRLSPGISEYPSRVYESQDAFHADYWAVLPPHADPAIRALAEKVRATPYRICFTHGDLTPGNILVDADYRPTGLIDWECAGWMPEYWEFTSAAYRRGLRDVNPGWFTVFDRALPGYESEEIIDLELTLTGNAR
ncbi:kinase-like protein [Peniophora sp. CONT]|nr:kinase-like protein [Peniophora sp. CONT]